MSSDFSTLDSMCESITDCPHSTPEWTESGRIVLRNQNIRNGVLDLSLPSFTNEEDYQHRIKRAKPQAGDIVFTREAPMGEVCLIPEDLDCCLGQRQVLLRPKKDVNGHYLFWALQSPFVQQQIAWNEGTGSTVSNVRIPVLKALNIPRNSDEDSIANVLSSLADKIELNRQTNQTLEQIAQALFKNWFVDFEPTRAKIAAKEAGASLEEIERAAMCTISGKTSDQLAQLPPEIQQNLKNTAALFPDVLMDSELGEIPVGWEVKSFGDVSNCFDSKRVPLSKPQREKKRPGDYPYYGATSVMDYVNEWIFDGIYLLLGEDGSVAKENGMPFTQYVWGKVWVNNHAHVLQGKDTVSTEHLMLFIQTQNIAAYITGAVQQKLNQGNMNSIPFIFADRKINEVFFQSIKSLYAQIRNLTEEIQRLENLKNLLLPKLLSGEIET